MAKPYLSIRVSLDDVDGEVSYELAASNGVCATRLGFWGCRDEFARFAEELGGFPRDSQHQVIYKLGDDNQGWGYHLVLRAFCVDSLGHSALEIHTVTPDAPPRGFRCQFFLLAAPTSLNELGEKLQAMITAKATDIMWEPHAL